NDVANVGHQIRLGQVATPVDAGEVKPRLVGAADEVAHRSNCSIGEHTNLRSSARRQADRTEVTRITAEAGPDFGCRRKAPAVTQTVDLAGLHLVERMITAYEKQPQLSWRRRRGSGWLDGK